MKCGLIVSCPIKGILKRDDGGRGCGPAGDCGNIGTTAKSLITEGLEGTWQEYLNEVGAIAEHIFTNGFDRVGHMNAGEATAILESAIGQAGDRIGNIN